MFINLNAEMFHITNTMCLGILSDNMEVSFDLFTYACNTLEIHHASIFNILKVGLLA